MTTRLPSPPRRPSPRGVAALLLAGALAAPIAALAGADLPYETRQAMARYPVALYAQKGCGPCDQARNWLRTRGIPYTEYSVETQADEDLFRQRFGTERLPLITLGRQRVQGFAASDLADYADAAGYPKQARLDGYAWPAPVPLAPASARPAPAAPRPAGADTPQAPRIDLPPPSKSGIQF